MLGGSRVFLVGLSRSRLLVPQDLGRPSNKLTHWVHLITNVFFVPCDAAERDPPSLVMAPRSRSSQYVAE